MTYSQQIKPSDNQDHEQEAQRIQNKSAKLFSIAEQKSNYRKQHVEYDKLERTDKPKLASKITKYLGEKAKAVLAVVVQKLKGSRTEFVANHEYLAKITNRGKRQNLNIINELRDYFNIEFHVKYEHEGKFYYNCYVFKNIEDIEGCAQKIACINPSATLVQQGVEAVSYKNNSSKRTRSSESKFSNNSISISSNEPASTAEIQNPTTEVVEAKVLVGKKKFIANKRKTVTNSERVTRYQKFKAYDKPKNLADHYPLSQEDCYELQKRSGKDYNLNGMNEILLDMSRKPELQGHSFVSKAKFMAYMTKAYRQEGRDVGKVNSPTFKLMKRRPQAEIVEIVTQNERERYLNDIETAGIHSRCDYTQLRAKIAGTFPVNLGYDCLTSMIAVKKKEEVFEVHMAKPVELTEHFRQLLLSSANAVGGYAGVEELDFVLKGSQSQAVPNSGFSDIPSADILEQQDLPLGNWGKVCGEFIAKYEHGESHYQNWLSGLEVTEDTESGVIQLRSGSDMVRDRIEQNYLSFLHKVAGKFGINKVEFAV